MPPWRLLRPDLPTFANTAEFQDMFDASMHACKYVKALKRGFYEHPSKAIEVLP